MDTIRFQSAFFNALVNNKYTINEFYPSIDYRKIFQYFNMESPPKKLHLM